MQINHSWIDITEKINTECIDFSVSTNPFGIPELIMQNCVAMVERIGVVNFYERITEFLVDG